MSVVYFLQMGRAGAIKIGTARNLKKRMNALSTPEPLVVLATIPGDRQLEQRLHAALAPYRKRGEWFRNCPEVNAVASLARLRGGDAIDRWLETTADKALCSAPPLSDDLGEDLRALFAYGVREVIRLHGLAAAVEASGKLQDAVKDYAAGKTDAPVSVLFGLAALEPRAFEALLARVNGSLIEAGEAIDAYRGKAA